MRARAVVVDGDVEVSASVNVLIEQQLFEAQLYRGLVLRTSIRFPIERYGLYSIAFFRKGQKIAQTEGRWFRRGDAIALAAETPLKIRIGDEGHWIPKPTRIYRRRGADYGDTH